MSISRNLQHIKSGLPENVTLVAVSKTKPLSDLQQAYDAGQRIFGENKIQEMTEKHQALPKDIEWHMIGHVQTNKVKIMAPYVNLIHGVDSFKLLTEIDKQAKKNQRTIPCLLQLHIAKEETKFGFDKKELFKMIESEAFGELKNIEVKGLMGMATFTENEKQIAKEFSELKSIFDQFSQLKKPNLHPEVLSMGMSGDYKIAIAHGSTMVRIGSSIFGNR